MGCRPTAFRYKRYSRTGDNGLLFDCDERKTLLLNGIIVAMGGAIGAVLRYLIGLLPLNPQNGFPLKTFCINVAGAFVIGLVAALSARASLNPRVTLFLFVCAGDRDLARKGKSDHSLALCAVESGLRCSGGCRGRKSGLKASTKGSHNVSTQLLTVLTTGV